MKESSIISVNLVSPTNSFKVEYALVCLKFALGEKLINGFLR